MMAAPGTLFMLFLLICNYFAQLNVLLPCFLQPCFPLVAGCIVNLHLPWILSLAIDASLITFGHKDGVLCWTWLHLPRILYNSFEHRQFYQVPGWSFCHHFSTNICWSLLSAENSRLHLWQLLILPSSRMVFPSYFCQPLLVFIAITREYQTVPLTSVDSTKLQDGPLAILFLPTSVGLNRHQPRNPDLSFQDTWFWQVPGSSPSDQISANPCWSWMLLPRTLDQFLQDSWFLQAPGSSSSDLFSANHCWSSSPSPENTGLFLSQPLILPGQ